MSKNIIPNIPLIDSPTQIDLIIQSIQVFLGENLPWLEYSFGRAWKRKEDRDGVIRDVPKVYVAKEEYLNVEPNQDWKSYIFFETPQPEQIISDTYRPQSYNYRTRERVNLILFADLKDVNRNLDYIYEERLKEDIIYLLNKLPFIESINTIVKEYSDVFNRYNVGREPDWFNDNYAALKFELDVVYPVYCYQGEKSFTLPIIEKVVSNPSTVLEYTAGEPIAANQVLMQDSGQAFLYIPVDSNYGKYIGVAAEPASTGQKVKVVMLGTIDGFPGVITGDTLFADPDNPGGVTQTPPIDAGELTHIVLTGVGTNKVSVNRYEPTRNT